VVTTNQHDIHPGLQRELAIGEAAPYNTRSILARSLPYVNRSPIVVRDINSYASS